jgi:hypothetical protein
VYGNLPDGFQSPYKTSVMEFPASWPGAPAHKTCMGMIRDYKRQYHVCSHRCDIRMVNPRFDYELPDAVNYYNCVVVLSGDGENQIISPMPGSKIGAVSGIIKIQAVR